MAKKISEKATPEENKPTTLATFVEANQALLEVLGVLVALAIFASGMPLRGFAVVLSFFFITATVLVLVELSARVPKDSTQTFRLRIFGSMLFWATIVLIAYWLLEFHQLLGPALGVGLGLLTFAGLLHLVIRIGSNRKLLEWRDADATKWRPLALTLAFIALAFFFMLAGATTNSFLHTLLDKIHNAATQITPTTQP